MFTFAIDYCIGVFISTVGALQIAFSFGKLYGLLFFKSPMVARTLGAALSIGGFVLFFGTGSRNINDYEGGLDAPSQALFFFYGALVALAVTLALSSVVNRAMRGADAEPDSGIDSLRDSNYALSLSRSLGQCWKRWQGRTRRRFFG